MRESSEQRTPREWVHRAELSTVPSRSRELPDGRTISVTYNANGNVTSITPPGRPAHEFEYTAINLESKYDPPALSPMPTPAVSDPATYFSYDLEEEKTKTPIRKRRRHP